MRREPAEDAVELNVVGCLGHAEGDHAVEQRDVEGCEREQRDRPGATHTRVERIAVDGTNRGDHPRPRVGFVCLDSGCDICHASLLRPVR